MSSKSQKTLGYTICGLHAFLALNAFAGGYYAMAGAEGVPIDWLRNSPFNDYFLPGLVLFVVVGGSSLFASISVFSNSGGASPATLIALAILFTWLLVQVAIIGYVSWMQPATAFLSLLILLLHWLGVKHVNGSKEFTSTT